MADIEKYKADINNYSLNNCRHGNQGYGRVLLQVFGLPGNGKSSFINSCKFALEGVFNEHAEAKKKQGGCTTRRVPYKLTDTIMMVDNRGCPTLNKYETGQIFAQLANLLPINDEVEWCEDYKKNLDRILEEDKKQNYSDFIVPIFVHSVNNRIPSQERDTYKLILKNARKITGINPIVVLTHKSYGGLIETRNTFEDMDSNKIYAIENYTIEDHQQVLGKHREILSFLSQILNEVNFGMEQKRDPKSERNDRMKFILGYLKDIDDEKNREAIREREEEIENLQKEKEKRSCPIL
ncbi:uncharacterized protein LOC134571402 [Pelobates fuscus]|uniref:uncharacterized protein LOC134571402 n=1 Tax=Pelobates fuscus TaxID=191477 RepID=UPI002FE4B062